MEEGINMFLSYCSKQLGHQARGQLEGWIQTVRLEGFPCAHTHPYAGSGQQGARPGQDSPSCA